MPTRKFITLASIGVVIKLATLWLGGKLLEDQIRSFLDAIERYQWWIVIGLFGITMIQSIRRQPLAPPDES
jgi:membrane protein DedA with SNARE-associated domain